MSECDPQHSELILAEEGSTMFDIDTWWCWCPDHGVEHAWNPVCCYSNGGRVYWSNDFKVDDKLCCTAEAA